MNARVNRTPCGLAGRCSGRRSGWIHTKIPAAHAKASKTAAGTEIQREQPVWTGRCSL